LFRGPQRPPFLKQNPPPAAGFGRQRARFCETPRNASEKVCRHALTGSPEALQSGSEPPQTFLRELWEAVGASWRSTAISASRIRLLRPKSDSGLRIRLLSPKSYRGPRPLSRKCPSWPKSVQDSVKIFQKFFRTFQNFLETGLSILRNLQDGDEK
jgi:hypothetical protein